MDGEVEKLNGKKIQVTNNPDMEVEIHTLVRISSLDYSRILLFFLWKNLDKLQISAHI